MGTLVLAGATSGSTTLTPVDAVTTVLTLPSATATLATLGANTFTGNQSITGTVTMPAQPAFLAYNSASDLNVTGNGAVATVDFDTEIFDQGSNFAADTFTAPVTGRYRFSTSVYLYGIVAATGVLLELVTSNRTYSLVYSGATVTGDQQISGSALCDMDSADTAFVRVIVTGMAGDTADILGASSSVLYTYFSGELVC